MSYEITLHVYSLSVCFSCLNLLMMNHKWVNYMKTEHATDLPAELFGCSVERYVTIHTCVYDCEHQKGSRI